MLVLVSIQKFPWWEKGIFPVFPKGDITVKAAHDHSKNVNAQANITEPQIHQSNTAYNGHKYVRRLRLRVG